MRDFVDFVLRVNPSVAASLIAAAVALFGYYFVQKRAQLRSLADAHRPQKIKVYDHFLSLVRIIQESGFREKRKKTPAEKKEVEHHLKEFTNGLIEWGSPAVIKQYRAFRRKVTATGRENILAMDDVLRVIRTDLGLSNSGLKRGDLVALLLKEDKEASLQLSTSSADKKEP